MSQIKHSKFLIVLFVGLLFSCSSSEETETVSTPTPTPTPEPPVSETTCDGTVTLTLDEIGGDYLNLSWTTDGDFSDYDIEYGLSGFSLGQGTRIRVNASSTEITNLDVNTDYEIYARGVCSSLSGDWSTSTSFTTLCEAGVYEGDVTLETQAEVTAFGEMCYSGINGNLIILGFYATSDPIVDLSPLSNLQEITGDLAIRQNPNLERLDGLENINSINHLRIEWNPVLASIEALSGISSITGRFNPTTSNDDFPGISITACRMLTSLEGLQNISTVKGITLEQLFNLESLNGLRGITEVSGKIYMYQNTSIATMDGLNQLTSVGEIFQLQSSDALVSLQGLENLQSVGTELRIYQNYALTSLSSLSNLQSVDVLDIRLNWAIENLSGINLEAVNTYFWIDSGSFTDLTGISGSSTTAYLNFDGCPNLTSLEGIELLEHANGIQLRDNNNLVDLTGLEGLRLIDSEMRFIDNSALGDFCALDGLINIGGFTGDWISSGNLLNPTLEDMQNGICN